MVLKSKCNVFSEWMGPTFDTNACIADQYSRIRKIGSSFTLDVIRKKPMKHFDRVDENNFELLNSVKLRAPALISVYLQSVKCLKKWDMVFPNDFKR